MSFTASYYIQIVQFHNICIPELFSQHKNNCASITEEGDIIMADVEMTTRIWFLSRGNNRGYDVSLHKWVLGKYQTSFTHFCIFMVGYFINANSCQCKILILPIWSMAFCPTPSTIGTLKHWMLSFSSVVSASRSFCHLLWLGRSEKMTISCLLMSQQLVLMAVIIWNKTNNY